DIWVEVADVARSIRVSGMKFPAQPVFQGQIVTHPKTVLRIGVVVIRAAVVILLNIVQVAISWDAQKEVAKRRARELAAEPEGAVVIGALKSQRTHGANVTVIEAEFQRMAAFVPRHVVRCLERPVLTDTFQSIGPQVR